MEQFRKLHPEFGSTTKVVRALLENYIRSVEKVIDENVNKINLS
jgi:hypothetical protein